MTDIVTGGSGFIGLHLVNKLGAASLHHSDIVHGHSYNCERLFFLSAYGNMAHHTDYRMMVKANVRDLLTLLNGFSGWLCYMSSSSVTLPVQTPYSRTKKAAEEILQSLTDLQSCIVRPFSVTGRGEQKEHLIPTLIRSCMEGTQMDFVPEATHDWIDVDDVVDALVMLADKRATGIYELGLGYSVSNQEVREIVEVTCGKKANVRIVKQLRDYDSQDWYCQDPLTMLMGWKPKKTLEESVFQMVENTNVNTLERRVIELSHRFKLTHVSSCLNTVNLLDFIYNNRSPNDPVILGNSHAALSLYVTWKLTVTAMLKR
jgi:nucleoside-diphosphate-sugar epimerase